MKRSALLIAAAVTLAAFPAVAQHHGPPPAADPSQAFAVLGTVTSFAGERGAGTPTLVVDDDALGAVAMRLGPLWFLRRGGFTAAPGDRVEALVYPCATCTVPLVAATVDNLTAGVSIILRDEDGLPLWTGGRGTGGGRGFCADDGSAAPGDKRGPHGGGGNGGGSGMGHDPGAGQGTGGQGSDPGAGMDPGDGGYPGGQCQWAGPDMSRAEVLTGTVVSLEVGFGGPRPSVILAVEGAEVEIYLMPYAPLAAAGFLIEPGAELEVVAAPWAAPWEEEEEVWVGISVTDPTTGLTVQLRDPETGYPVTGAGGGFGHGGNGQGNGHGHGSTGGH